MRAPQENKDCLRNLSKFWALSFQREAGSGEGGAHILGSAMESTVTGAPVVCNSPKIRGLHEIIKAGVAEEWTLCFISAPLQAMHVRMVAELC